MQKCKQGRRYSCQDRDGKILKDLGKIYSRTLTTERKMHTGYRRTGKRIMDKEKGRIEVSGIEEIGNTISRFDGKLAHPLAKNLCKTVPFFPGIDREFRIPSCASTFK